MPRDITITTYTFSELDEEAQDKVLEKFYDINVQDSWWYEFIEEDAERIGLKITEFDLYRHYCKGEFTEDVKDVIAAILKEHGESTETYKDALRYQEKLKLIQDVLDEYAVDTVETDDRYYKAEGDKEELEKDFLYDLLEDYRSLLQSEWDYSTSREAIVETLEANDYRFTKEGKVV